MTERSDTLREALEKCAEWNHLHGGWPSEMERIIRAALATPETAASETDLLIQLAIQRTLAFAQNPALPLPTVASVRAAVKELGE